MNEAFDPKKLFNDAKKQADKQTIKTGYEQLRQIMYDVFENNSYLSDEENLAIAKDMLQTNTGVQYDNIVNLWFKTWLMNKRGSNDSKN